MLTIGAGPLRIADLVAVARDDAPVALAPAAVAAIAASHRTVLDLVACGAAVYGVSTGLGAAVDTSVRADGPDWQRGIPRARAVGVGPRATQAQVRAMMAARVSRMAAGCSGVSPGMVEALVALLNRGVHPVVRLVGSVGQADLAPLAEIGCVLAGEGEAELGGAVLPAAEALARAGIAPPPFGPKDGLALVSSNAAAVGMAALVVADAGRALDASLGAVSLSLEGFRGSLAPFDPRAAAIRPAPGQAAAADCVRRLIEGSDLEARRLQDPLSFRTAASVAGAAADALRHAADLVELELNTSDDNPAIIDGIALPNANFDPTALVLAIEHLGQALLRTGAASAARVLRLMSPAVSDLPRFLAAAADGRNGFATVQKTVSALLADMQHAAAPMPVVTLAAADGVEDYATMSIAVVEKTGRVVDGLFLLTAIELMAAAQACDLRGPIRLGQGTRALHATVRSVVPRLDEDRRTGPEIEALAAMVRDGAFAGAL